MSRRPTPLQAGDLNRQVTFLRLETVADAAGDPAPTYVEAGTAWASRRPAPGVERFQNAQSAATAPAIFRVRWSAASTALTTNDRVRCGGVTYDIASLNEIGFRLGMEIVAEARTE